MSLPAVSEALIRLELEGLLVSQPRTGTRPRIPSREEVEGYYTVREAIEAQAARLFAASSTDEELGKLRLLALRLDRLVETQGPGVLHISLSMKGYITRFRKARASRPHGSDRQDPPVGFTVDFIRPGAPGDPCRNSTRRWL